MGLIMLPLVIPSIILGIALLTLVIKVLGIEPSLYTIGAAHVLHLRALRHARDDFAPGGVRQEPGGGVARLGEGAWMTFRRVTLPLGHARHRRQHAALLTTSFDEFLLAFFLSGNEATLPIYIWGQLRLPPSCRTCWRSAPASWRPHSSSSFCRSDCAAAAWRRHDVPPPEPPLRFLVLAVHRRPARRRRR